MWNVEKSTKISQTTQFSSTLYSERFSIFRFREETANWYKVRSKNIHPWNLTNRYQKWWYRYQTCISFQIWLFWVSILNFGRGMLIKSEYLNIKLCCGRLSCSITTWFSAALGGAGAASRLARNCTNSYSGNARYAFFLNSMSVL